MWTICTAKENTRAIMKPHQRAIISMMQEADVKLGTSEIHGVLLDEGFVISRATVINYCQLLAENDVVAVEERTCQGGMKRVYSKLMGWESILEFIHIQVLEKMTGAFPDSKYLRESVELLSK